MFPNYQNRNMGGPNSNSSGNEVSFQDRIKGWWSEVPLFVRFIIITTTIFYILSWFLSSVTKALLNLPLLTVYYFQIWRLLTTVFITLSIFNILFAFLAWIPDAIKLENSTGTVKYMCTFFTNSIIIQLIYIIISLVLSVFSQEVMIRPSSGLWPLILAEITILCLTNPQNQLMMMFLPCLIPAKYYPWTLFAFFTVLNMNLQFDILAGILYGYLFHHYLKSKIQFSDEFINRVENYPLINKLVSINSFVPLSKAISNAGGNAFFIGQGNRVGNNASTGNNNNNGNNVQMNTRPQAPVSTPFQGVGSVLGGKKIRN